MREIKFRAWDTYKKQWVATGFHVIGEVTMFDLVGQYCHENPNPKYDIAELRFNDIEMTEFTGLKDCTGKEIWEGDILRYERLGGQLIITNQVTFNQDKCGFYVGLGHIWNDMEVIGNIFEHQELLKANP